MTAWVISDSAERTLVNDSSYSHLKKKKKEKKKLILMGEKVRTLLCPNNSAPVKTHFC